MARDWRRAVSALLAAAMLGCACVLGALAQSEEGGEQERARSSADGAQSAPAAKKRQDPADAQRAIEAAQKQLQAGRAEQAVQALSTTLAGGNLPPAILAKAFYLRGIAQRRLGRPANAISDLNSALWLRGGLGGDERGEAMQERAAAYTDAGLRAPDDSAAPAPKTASSNWFGGLFGGGGSGTISAPAPIPPRVSAAAVERVEPAPAPKAATVAPEGWSNKTQVETSRAPTYAAAPAPAKVEAAAEPVESPPSRLEGSYAVQLAAVRTEAEALALANKAKREQGSVLASREQTMDRQVFGNMGAFYRVRFGPFASSQETEAVCARLLGAGIDCMTVGP
jgi:cell division septation protein DedD